MNRRDFIQSSFAAALALAVGCGKQESASGSGGSGVASGKGSVRDSSGRPIAGVAVTDGFSVVKTDSDGRFSLDLHENAEFVYLCVPAAYEIPYGLDGYPAFFKRLRTAPDLDFTLTPLPGGPQTKWNFLVVSDIHGNTSEAGGVPFAKLDRVVVPDIAASAGDYDNLYSVILGDIMTAASDNDWGYMYGKVKHSVSGAHFFMVPGNHDWWTSSQDTEPSIKHFTRRFGPTRWSFDRGDVHIVGMNNILTSGLKADGEMMTGANNDYQAGFTDEEFEWLRQDLSMVDKSKMVILCVHVPFGDGDNHSTGRARHVAYHDETVALLSQFASARIFSGHSHRNIRYAIDGGEKPVLETVHPGIIANYAYHTRICSDGTPSGYQYYSFDGPAISNVRFKAIGRESQLRVYDGNAEISGTHHSPYSWKLEKGWLVANVFFINRFETGWKVELFQNGVKCCDMQRMTTGAYTSSGISVPAYTVGLPVLGTPGSEAKVLGNRDWWLWQQFCEEAKDKYNKNGNTFKSKYDDISGSWLQTSEHIYMGKLATVPQDISTASFEVRVSDPYGNVFTCSELTPMDGKTSDMVFWEKT